MMQGAFKGSAAREKKCAASEEVVLVTITGKEGGKRTAPALKVNSTQEAQSRG